MWKLGRLPQARLHDMFDAVQLKSIDSQLVQARNVAQSLRGNKLWPDEDNDKADDTPSSKK